MKRFKQENMDEHEVRLLRHPQQVANCEQMSSDEVAARDMEHQRLLEVCAPVTLEGWPRLTFPSRLPFNNGEKRCVNCAGFRGVPR